MGERTDRADSIARALHSAFCRGASRRDLLTLAARKILDSAPSIDGVYAYVSDGDSLQLEAYEGASTDHARIPIVAHASDPSRLEKHVVDMISHDWGWHRAIVFLIRRHDLVLGSIMVRTSSTHDPAGVNVARVADALAALL